MNVTDPSEEAMLKETGRSSPQSVSVCVCVSVSASVPVRVNFSSLTAYMLQEESKKDTSNA